MSLENPLGKPAEYIDTYTPSLLHSIERATAREEIGVEPDNLPFQGEDVWMCYELTWLGERGKPEVSAMRIKVPATSPCIVESKSLKLYLGSLAQTRFVSRAELLNTLNSDLGLAFRAPVMLELIDIVQVPEIITQPPGICLDGLDVKLSLYERDPELLALEEGEERVVKETVHTNLFRSLCPVTGQPDFATMVIRYLGRPITRSSLLAYLVSFRNHPRLPRGNGRADIHGHSDDVPTRSAFHRRPLSPPRGDRHQSVSLGRGRSDAADAAASPVEPMPRRFSHPAGD